MTNPAPPPPVLAPEHDETVLAAVVDAVVALAAESRVPLVEAARDLAHFTAADRPYGDPVVRWSIETIGTAEWAMRVVARADRAIAAVAVQAAEWHRQIDEWAAGEQRDPEATRAFFDEHLRRWALGERARTGKATTKVPSGVVRTTEQPPRVKIDDPDVFVVWAETVAGGDHPELVDVVKVEKSPLVSKLAAHVVVVRVVEATMECGHTYDYEQPAAEKEPVAPGDHLLCQDCTDTREVAAVAVSYYAALDGREVPGTVVDPGGITAKVTAS